jgi:hypothetical protein
MKISHEVRDYAAQKELQEVGDAIELGMEEMADQYNEQGRNLYHKV